MLVGGKTTPLKNMKVSWDDDIPKIWENKIHVPNHQPAWFVLPNLIWATELLQQNAADFGQRAQCAHCPPWDSMVYAMDHQFWTNNSESSENTQP